tara:strand:- start:190 stop:822 length:633 start_codon:yes stop_codon:yes gene_type:complete
MKKLIATIFGAALFFSTSVYSDVTVGLKVGNGDLEGTSKSYTRGTATAQAGVSSSKDSMFGAIFVEKSFGNGVSGGVEYVPLDANITLDGSNSSTGAKLSDFTTAYVMYMRDTGNANLYGKLGYARADIGAINASQNTTVNTQDDTLDGIMVGVGLQTEELQGGLNGRLEITFTDFDDVSATTTSNGSPSVKKTGNGELLTVTFGLSKTF